MGFLIKSAFWLSLVVLLLPAGDYASDDAADVSTGDAIHAAQTFIADMSGFCSRNAVACETGSAALTNFTAKAQNGAQMLYGYLGQINGNNTQLETRAVAAQRIPAPVPANDNEQQADQQYSTNGLAVPAPAPSAVATHTGSINGIIARSLLGLPAQGD